MKHNLPTMYLPRNDDTVEVFCANAYRRNKPCDGRIRMTRDGVGLTGIVAYFESGTPRYLCSWRCVESYAKRVK